MIHVAGELSVLKEKEKTVRPEVFNSKDQRGLTPLHKAVGLNKKAVAEFLLSKVFLLNHPTTHTTLHLARLGPLP